MHQLRARRAGNRILIDFHLILPRDLLLDESHREVKELEKILSDHFAGRADILIHADPCTEPECPICGYDPCIHRRAGTKMQRLWRKDVITHGPYEGHKPTDREKP